MLILLTSELGFRIGEILGIDYTKDIDYENHEIRVDFRDDNENDARAKNAEERRGRVSDDTFEFLLYYIGEYWDILQKQEYLFINIKGDTIGKPLRVDSVYDMFERMEKKTGIKITPHMLRRYYANTRWEADWPLEMISQALGHKHRRPHDAQFIRLQGASPHRTGHAAAVLRKVFQNFTVFSIPFSIPEGILSHAASHR